MNVAMTVTTAVVITLVTIGPASIAQAEAAVNYGASGELYVPFPVENGQSDAERSRIRTIELTSNAKLDELTPGLAARLTIGATDLSGNLVFNLREGFVQATDLLPGLDVRAGKFFLPVGILNQTRKSAWAFVSSPTFFVRFFDDNGVADTGLDLNYRFGSQIAVRFGLTNGYRFDSATLNGGARPMTPTHFVRPKYSFTAGASKFEVGLNYLGRVSDTGESLKMSGVDFSFAPVTDDHESWSLQAELFDRAVNPPSLPLTEDVGGYAYLERGLNQFAAGARFDYYQIRSLTDASGAYRPNLNIALSPTVVYRGRDHLRLQGSYTYLRETRSGNSDRSEQIIELRLVTEFGNTPKFRTPLSDPSSL